MLDLGISINGGLISYIKIGDKKSDVEDKEFVGTIEYKDGYISKISITISDTIQNRYKLYVSDKHDIWIINLKFNKEWLYGSHFGGYGEAADKFPLLNSYREEILNRVKYTNDLIEIR